MTTETEFAAVPPAVPVAEPTVDIPSLILAESIRDSIWTAEHSTTRSQQKAVGWSGIGDACARKLSHQLSDTAISNRPDPLKAMVGTGGHLALAHHYERLGAGSGRYATEIPVTYRGIPGTADLLDRRRGVVIDWKFKPVSKIKRLIREGVPTLSPGYVVQAHGYGAGLRAAGEQISAVALAFIPSDATLAEIHVWSAPLDTSVADKAVDRLSALQGFPPAQIPPRPGPLCGWCPYYRPGWAGDLNQACPGTTAGAQPEGAA
jgi:hypothetical protein